MTVKTEIKVEPDDSLNYESSSFPDQSIELDNDSHDDSNIIISNDITGSIKLEEASDFSEVTEKPVKKKKKHSKSAEQKKAKSKNVNKTKRKHLNISIFDINEPLDVSDADVQRKLMAMPSLHAHKSLTDSQSRINDISESIIFTDNETNTSPVKVKTVLNIASSGQVASSIYSDTKGTDNMDERINVYTKSTKKTNPVSVKTFPKQQSLLKTNILEQTKPIKIDKAVESEFIGDDTKIILQDGKSSGYPICKSVGTMLTERSIPNYSKKDIIKAPRLSVLKSAYVSATEVSPKVDPERLITEETDNRTLSSSVVVLPKTWPIAKPREPKLSTPGIMFVNPGFASPPILQKETTVKESRTDAKTLELSKSVTPCTIQVPQMESIFTKSAVLSQPLAQAITCQNISGSTDVKILGKRSTTDTSKMMATKFWQLSSNNSNVFFAKDTKEDAQVYSSTNLDNSEMSASSSSLGLPTNSSNTFFFTTAPKYTNVSEKQSSMTIDFNKRCARNPASMPNVTGSIVKIVPKLQDHLLLKTLNQHDEGCSRKPVKKTSTIVSNVKSVSTQVDHPLEIVNLNYTTSHSIPDLQGPQKTITIHQEQFSNVIESGDKLQTQNVQRSSDNIYANMPSLKPIKLMSRRKSKEKLKKATTRKKEIEMKTAMPNPDEANIATCSINQSPSVSNRVSMVPGHISDMLYPSVPNNDLLKAFNDYWSAQISHCAICAPFTSSCNGHGRLMPPDWKYCKPTVLPDSSPIWVSF